MSYHYDNYGWFDGEVTKDSPRSTDIKPMPDDGDLKPNWTGYEWVLLEYKEPPVVVQTLQEPTVNQIRTALLGTMSGDEVSALFSRALTL